MTTDLLLLSRVAFRGQEITGPRLRGLLALLAGELRTGSSTARLVDGLWPDERPENPTKALQVLISRIRSQVGADVVVSTPTGYRLSLREEQVDSSTVLLRATASAQRSRAGDHAAALAEAEAGLALWEGEPEDEADGDDPLAALRAERASAYRWLMRSRALALSRLGRRAEAVAPLAEVAAAHPRDEEVLLELLRCEAETAGPSTALARYEAYRKALRDELGTQPGTALQTLHQELLQHEEPAVRHGVPYEPNPLLGRDDDIAAVADLLHSSRVTSVVGAGGLGKTRLAHVVSRQAEQRVVHFVALAGVSSDDDVAAEVASVLGVHESRRTPAGGFAVPTDVLSGLVGALGPGPALLVLDNCEHVIRGAAELVQLLVSSTRDLRVLTTSRAPLGLSSESVYLLPELALPTAVELFEQRARAARPGAELPRDTVTELCRHLDGLPLAVELAAARIRVLSVAEIARRLEDRFALLRGGARDAPERHRTLLAVVDWSWNLLEPAGREALRALSVFPGGFTADAARWVLGGGSPDEPDKPEEPYEPDKPEELDDPDVLDVLAELVGQSLLKVSDTAAGTRFWMLETVREFSTAHRAESGETDAVTGRFLDWARDFGVAHHESPFGAEPYAAGERIRAEQDNLVTALRLALARADGGTVAAVTAVLSGQWAVETNYTRMMALVDETAWLLSHFRPEPGLVEATRTAAAISAGTVFMVHGPSAIRSLVTLRRLPAAPPDTVIRAVATVLAAPEVLGPDHSALLALCDSREPMLAGVASVIASYVYQSEQDEDAALRAAGRMLEALESGPSPWMRVLAHSRMSELLLNAERDEEARRHMEQALKTQEEHGELSDAMGLRWGLVLANLGLGDVDEAERWLAQATVNQDDEALGPYVPDLGARAEIALLRGRTDDGLRWWRQAVERLDKHADQAGGADPFLQPWALEIKAATVLAHARHGRLGLVAELADELPTSAAELLAQPAAHPGAQDIPAGGAALLALGTVDLERGSRTGDERATAAGVWMTALAERLGVPRNFQPTMSSERARDAAEHADGPAYADADASYAGLDGEELRAAALAALRSRG